MAINYPYINFNGNAEEAFTFLQISILVANSQKSSDLKDLISNLTSQFQQMKPIN